MSFHPWTRAAVPRLSNRTRSHRRSVKLRFGELEDRCVPATFRWINGAGGDFATAANWEDQAGNPGVPGATDDALILLPSGVTVTSVGTNTVRNLTSTATLSVTGGTLTAAAANLAGPADVSGGALMLGGPSTATTLTLSAGTLSGDGSLALSTGMTWTGGTLGVELHVVDDAILDINGVATKALDNDMTLTNDGTINWNGTGDLEFRAFTAILNNGLLQDVADHNITATGSDGAASILRNAGVYVKQAGPGVTDIDVRFDNTGTLRAESGTLRFNGTILQVEFGSLRASSWYVGAGATLDMPGTSFSTNYADITLGGPGATFAKLTGVSFNSGDLTLGAGANFTTGAFLTNYGHITIGPNATFGVGALSFDSFGNHGQLTFQIKDRPGTNNFGKLNAASGIDLDGGTISITLLPGAHPLASAGDAYSLAVGGHPVSGTARAIVQDGAGTTSVFNVTTGATSLTATAITDVTDLSVSAVVPSVAPAAPGEDVTVAWTVTNNATVPTAASAWVDAVYLSTSPTFDDTAVLLGRVPHSGTLPGLGSYPGSFTGPLPGLAAGTYYVFVCSDADASVADPDRPNPTAAATTLTVIAPAALTNGVGTPGTVAGGADAWYRVDVPGGTGLRLTATFAAAGNGEVYVGYQQFPGMDTAIGTATDPLATTQRVILPTTQAGTYYVRVHGLVGGSFTIQSDTLSFDITSLVNTTGGNTGSATLTVHGVGFTPNTTISLATGGVTRTAMKVLYVDSDTVYATFDLKGLATGSYDVKAVDGARTATSVGGYMVTNATAGKLSYQIIQPAAATSGRTTYAYIEFTNNGGTDIPAPLLVLESTGSGGEFELVGEPQSEDGGFGWIYFLPTSTDAPAGIIPPGYRGRIPVAMSSNASAGSDFGLELTEVNSGRKVPWVSFDYIVQIPDQGFDAPVERAIFANFVAGVGKTSDTYVAALRDAATYLAIAGTPIRDAGALIAYLLRQADTSFPSRTLAQVTDASFPAPGLGLDFTRDFVPSVQGRYRSGRLGAGWVDNWDISVKWDGFSKTARVYNAGIIEEFVRPDFNSTTFYSSDGEDVLTFLGTRFVLVEHDGTATSFRADNQLDFVQDASGARVTAGYDAAKHLASLTHSNGKALTFTANKAGLITSVTDPAGLLTTYKYSTNHLASATGPGGVEKYTYKGGPAGSKNALTSVTAASGVKTVLTYDKLSRLIGRTIGKSEAVVYTYGPGGGITVTRAGGSAVTMVTDFEGRVAALRDNTGADVRYSFDAHSRVIRAESDFGEVWAIERDSDGKAVGVTDPLGQTLHYTYQDDLLSSFTDARGFTTSYQFDGNGKKVAITPPAGGTERFVYDPVGDLVQTVNRRGNAVSISTNADGQVTRRQFADGSHIDYVYTAGNLTSATDATGTTTLIYFPNGNLQKVMYPGGRFLEFTYDKGGRRASSVDQDGFTTTYAYDAAGRLAELRDGTGASIVSYSYDAGGRLRHKQNSNGTFTDYTYDAFGRIASIANFAPGGATNSKFDYTYDAVGNVGAMVTNGVTTTYGYDLLGQLTSVAMPGRTIDYAYDPAGNRTLVTDNGVPTTYTINSENQVTAMGATTFSYDADGNRQTMTDGSGTTTYSWDDLSRLSDVTSPTDTFAYTYDVFSNLLTTTQNGQTVTNLTDPFGLGTVTAQYGPSGLIAHYVNGHGLEARLDQAGRAFYDFDRLGSVAGLTDGTGAYVNRYSYLPFGETTTLSAGLTNPFTYVGKWGVSSDGNGLFNMRARLFDARTGGFVSDDPLGFSAGDPNIRRYVGNNPVESIDPSGLKCDDDEISRLKAEIKVMNDWSSALQRYDAMSQEYQAALSYIDKGPPGTTYQGQTREQVAKGAKKFHDTFDNYRDVKERRDLQKQLDDCEKEKQKKKDHPDFQEASKGHPAVPKTKKPPQTQAPSTKTKSRSVNPPAGPNGTVPKGKSMPYSVDVDNPTPSQAVHHLHVTQQLDSDLDFNTFELGDMDLGGLIVDVPAGRSSYQTRIDLRNTEGVYVDVKAGIDRSTGLVTWDVTALDPATLQVPESANLGLLVPAPFATFAEGSFFYFVGVRNDVTNGASVDSSATITIDGGTPVVTPIASSLVDADGPVTMINPLPVKAPASFNVGWSGTDANGVAFYDVFVSVDDAPFVLWQASTTSTTAKYKGKGHHKYEFAVVGHDNVGNATPFPGVQVTTNT